MLTRDGLSEKNVALVREFDRYVIEHPEFSKEIPNDALVVMQIEGDDQFNRWARETAHKAAEKNQSVIYVTITELKPVRSRIEKVRVEKAA